MTHLQYIKCNSFPLLLSFNFFSLTTQLSLIFSKPVPKLSHLHCYIDKFLHNITFDYFHGIKNPLKY